MQEIGKWLFLLSLVLGAAGLFLWLGGRLPHWLGRLPGDIHIQRQNFSFHFPIATSLLLSLALSLLVWLLKR